MHIDEPIILYLTHLVLDSVPYTLCLSTDQSAYKSYRSKLLDDCRPRLANEIVTHAQHPYKVHCTIYITPCIVRSSPLQPRLSCTHLHLHCGRISSSHYSSMWEVMESRCKSPRHLGGKDPPSLPRLLLLRPPVYCYRLTSRDNAGTLWAFATCQRLLRKLASS